MSVERVARAPRLRCHACGDQRVEAVCHHCARPLCAGDVVPYAGRGLFLMGHAATQEMRGLGLERADDRSLKASTPEPAHCTDCFHVVQPGLWAWIAVGTLVAALGLLLTMRVSLPWLGRGALAGGVLLAGVATVVHERRRRQMRATRPPMPTLPKIESISVTEQLRCSQRVDAQGRVHARCDPVDVRCEAAVHFREADRKRLALYRRRFGLGEHEPVSIHAGFLALHGAVGLRAVHEPEGWPQLQVLALREDARRIECFASRAPRASDEGRWSWRYGVLNPLEPPFPPVQVVPWFGEGSDRRELHFLVQWKDVGSWQPAEDAVSTIELVELEIPQDWGDIESGPRMLVSETQESATSGQVVRRVQWRHWELSEAQRTRRASPFWIRFRDSIARERVLRGRVVMAFNRGFSGVTGATWYQPTGRRSGRSPGGSGAQRTLVELRVTTEFEFSLNALSYNGVGTNDATSVPRVDLFSGVVPDGRTVIRLTNALAGQYPFYRKLEQRPGLAAGGEIIRAWDITGRVYREGVVPVDWHLIVSGQESVGSAQTAQGSFTRTELTVSSRVRTPETEPHLEACRGEISSRIRSALTAVESRHVAHREVADV